MPGCATSRPRMSPHGWEVGVYHDDTTDAALRRSDQGRGTSDPLVESDRLEPQPRPKTFNATSLTPQTAATIDRSFTATARRPELMLSSGSGAVSLGSPTTTRRKQGRPVCRVG